MDSTLLYGLKHEINEYFLNSTINNVTLLDKNKFLFNFSGKKNSLLLCPSPNQSYLYITAKSSPPQKEKAPFYDVLDKYINHAVLTKVDQSGLERVIKFYFQKSDALGINTTETVLIFELIGRQSNLILIDDNSCILDCFRRYTKDDSQRILTPKQKYIPPVPLGKSSILEIKKAELENYFRDFQQLSIKKALSKVMGDLSPMILKEVLFRANISTSKPINQMSTTDLNCLFKEIVNLRNILMGHKFYPNILMDDSGEAIKVSSIILKQYLKLYKKDYHNINEACRIFYEDIEATIRKKSLKKLLEKSLKNQISRLEKKLIIQKRELKSAQNWQEYKLFGELINANIYQIKKGLSQIEVENYYDPQMRKVKIPLNPTLSPQENAGQYFKLYKKSKSGKDIISNQIETTEGKLSKISNLYDQVEQVDNFESLVAWKDKLVQLGYLAPQKKIASKGKEISGFNPRRFITSEGWTVLIGRNNKENDILTLHMAKKDDLWFHAQGASGSHVILKREGKKKQISKKSIMEAASLAAGYSSAKHSAQVPVIYTERRFVRKPKGSPPGGVVCTKEKTIFVEPKQKL